MTTMMLYVYARDGYGNLPSLLFAFLTFFSILCVFRIYRFVASSLLSDPVISYARVLWCTGWQRAFTHPVETSDATDDSKPRMCMANGISIYSQLAI